MDDYAEVYVDGKRLDRSHWDDGHVLLTEHARPGQTFAIAVRGINEAGPGQLHFGRMVYDFLGAIQPALGQYVREAQFTAQAAGQTGNTEDRARLTETLARSEAQVDLAALRGRDLAKAGASLDAAHKTLLTLAPITRQYDVYYVGHAHIDMNWLWPWPETIDVCHRTWDSAMNLMDKFPDFGFVQSQPGAYRAIQEQYPAEFARMQTKSAQKQWDTVGGLYDESDTNMPSGEGLARSLFLGQRYFKTNFGHYAETGWLPDSFGHSRQLPQLLQEAGIRSFYHTRCGDGIRYAWWQGPDGSRVLKANTDSYDEPIAPDQLLRPFTDERQYGLK
jgi:alpha-mannosidase